MIVLRLYVRICLSVSVSVCFFLLKGSRVVTPVDVKDEGNEGMKKEGGREEGRREREGVGEIRAKNTEGV